jgi:hypothetical protein
MILSRGLHFPHVAHQSSAKQVTVFAAELRAACVPHLEGGGYSIDMFRPHQLSSVVQSQPLSCGGNSLTSSERGTINVAVGIKRLPVFLVSWSVPVAA